LERGMNPSLPLRVRSMIRVLFGLFAVLLATPFMTADDKKADDKVPFAGTWVKEADGFEIKLTFKKKNEMQMSVMNGVNGIVSTVEYTLGKDGAIKGKITKVEEKGEFPAKPPKGFEFTCKVTVKDKKAKLEDFKCDIEGASMIMEGEYEKKDD
jgi:hypothetical protein